MQLAPIAQPGRVMPAGRRTSLMQQISLADVNPAAAAERRATLAQKKDEENGKPKPRGPSELGVDAASLAELVARHEAKVETIDENSVDEASDGEDPLFMPEDMRCLALLAEEPLMDTMRTFIRKHKSELSCFRIVADDDVRAVLAVEMKGKDMVYGPTISSPTQGGDQQVAAMLAMELLGAVIQFGDPCTMYAHHADTQSLHRLLNVHNCLYATNYTTGSALLAALKAGLQQEPPMLARSFFETLESPAVADYIKGQKALVSQLSAPPAPPPPRAPTPLALPPAVAGVALPASTPGPLNGSTPITLTPDSSSNGSVSPSANPTPILTRHATTGGGGGAPASNETLARGHNLDDESAALAPKTPSGVPVRRQSFSQQVAASQKENGAHGGIVYAPLDQAMPVPLGVGGGAGGEAAAPVLAAVADTTNRMGPGDMRCLALISHNHMKPAMKSFVQQNKEVLKKFRLTGTDSTMKMLKSMLGEGPEMKYGPTCTSGPLGGDAQVSAQIILEDIGGVIFFTDPLSAHPHYQDIESLIRLVNLYSILHASNTTTADALVHTLGAALEANEPAMLPSFFHTLSSSNPLPEPTLLPVPPVPKMEPRPFKLFKRASTMRLSFKSDNPASIMSMVQASTGRRMSDDWEVPSALGGDGSPARRGRKMSSDENRAVGGGSPSAAPAAAKAGNSFSFKSGSFTKKTSFTSKPDVVVDGPSQSTACAIM